jgi:hypothetical protein
MKQLAYQLFKSHKPEFALRLLQYHDTRQLVARELGNVLLNNNHVLPHPMDQLLIIVSLANFASEQECHFIATILYNHIPDIDILPRITKYRGKELGEKCLIGLALFYDAIEQLHRRHAAPEPEFYRLVGRKSFYDAGMHEISKHFTNWEIFLNERLTE